MNIKSIQRPEPLVVYLEGADKWYVISPPTREQVRKAISLDRDANHTELVELSLEAKDERIARQLSALANHATECTVQKDGRGQVIEAKPIAGTSIDFGALTAQEEQELVTVILCWHNGLDPAEALGAEKALKKKAFYSA